MCDCIEQVNNKLKAVGNTIIDIPIVWSADGLDSKGVLVTTCKRDKSNHQKPSKLFASYCPFCGEPYNNQNTVAPESGAKVTPKQGVAGKV